MQGIPIQLTDVTLFAYHPTQPILVPVIEYATATYTIGTLITDVFYNLSIEGGERVAELQLHNRYYASGKDQEGREVTTHWMYCTNAGNQPELGYTQHTLQTQPTESSGKQIHLHLGDQQTQQNQTALNAHDASTPDSSRYITLAELKDVQVSYTLPPPAIGTIVYIEDGKGTLIATRTGTPHLTGFQVDVTSAKNPFHTGMQNLSISAKRVDNDEPVFMRDLEVVSQQDPVTFLPDYFFQTSNVQPEQDVHIHLHN